MRMVYQLANRVRFSPMIQDTAGDLALNYNRKRPGMPSTPRKFPIDLK